jgi:hypothetical protein
VRPKHVYLSLCVLGTVVPYYYLLAFLGQHGLDPALFGQQLFSTPISSFFGVDVIITSVVLWVLVYVDGRRLGLRHLWAPIAANLVVGVSLGLPLFLYIREHRLSAQLGRTASTTR